MTLKITTAATPEVEAFISNMVEAAKADGYDDDNITEKVDAFVDCNLSESERIDVCHDFSRVHGEGADPGVVYGGVKDGKVQYVLDVIHSILSAACCAFIHAEIATRCKLAGVETSV